MFLRLDRLPKDRFAAAILFLHSARRFFHVVEHPGLHRCRVSDHGSRGGIDLQQRAAAGTSNFDGGRNLRHFANDTAKTGEVGYRLRQSGFASPASANPKFGL